MPASRTSPGRRRDRGVEALLFAALAAQALLLVALILHGRAEDESRGVVGAIGHGAASLVWGLFGVLSFLLVALGIWTTAIRLARREVSSPGWRAAGFALFLIGGCALVHQFFPTGEIGGPRPQPFGQEPGGAVGSLAFGLFRPAFGTLGAFLLSVVLLCTGLAFATDWLLYEMAYGVLRRGASLFGLVKRFWPEPVFAGGAAAGADDALPTEPLRRASAAPVALPAAMQSAVAAPPAAAPFAGPFAPPSPPASLPATSAPPAPSNVTNAPTAIATPSPAVPAPTAAPAAAAPARSEPNPARFDALLDGVSFDDPVVDVPPELVPPPLPKFDPAEEAAEAPVAPAEDDAPLPPADALTDGDPSDVASDTETDADPDDAAADDDDDDAAAPASAGLAGPSGARDDAPEADAALADSPPKPLLVKLELPPRPRPAGLRVERPRAAGEYEFPSHQLLERPKPRNLRQLEQAIQSNADVLQRTLAEFKIEGQVVAYQQGPVVTMLEVALAPGTKVTRIHSLSDDLAMALKAEAVRIVAPIPGKSTVGVEIPNPVRDDVRMVSLLEAPEFRETHCAVPMLLGCAADGRPLVEDLATMPHLLIAGSTGSGKSVCINTILLSILLTRSPDDVRLILIDPKQVELAFFADIPHLLAPVVTDMKRASAVLEWALDKMEERYDLLRRFEVRNIASYNELGEAAILKRAKELEMDDEVVQVKLPYVVIVVDELADLMLAVGKDVETAITRLAQKSRAVGIHVVLATQRPSTDVITGLIKANMPTRIAFKVASKIDSRVILDQNGAEKLLGMGDMLYMPPRSSTIARAQGTYAADREVKRIVGFLRERYTQTFSDELVNISTAPLLDSSEKDELYDQAVRIVLGEQRGSASLLQRALAIGYTRASRLLDLMRAEGVVGAYKGSKASEVLMSLEDYEARVAAEGGSARRDDDGSDDE